MSTLKVGTIQDHTNSTTAITIDSSGFVNLPVNNNITIFGLNSNTAITSNTPSTITGWTRFDNQNTYGFKQVGTAMSESGGFFTTSKLGVYRVEAEVYYYRASSPGARYVQVDLCFTPNGQSEVAGDISDNVPYTNSDYTYNLANRLRYYNFNHVNDKVRLRVGTSNNITIKGSGASDYDTQIMFTWVAPPVT